MDIKSLLNDSGIKSETINNLTQDISSNGDIFQGITLEYIILTFIISIFGIAYFRYGKKNNKYLPMISGILLMVFPYFIYDIKYIIIISIILGIVPFIIKY